MVRSLVVSLAAVVLVSGTSADSKDRVDSSLRLTMVWVVVSVLRSLKQAKSRKRRGWGRSDCAKARYTSIVHLRLRGATAASGRVGNLQLSSGFLH